jgi:hypothetical protein
MIGRRKVKSPLLSLEPWGYLIKEKKNSWIWIPGEAGSWVRWIQTLWNHARKAQNLVGYQNDPSVIHFVYNRTNPSAPPFITEVWVWKPPCDTGFNITQWLHQYQQWMMTSFLTSIYSATRGSKPSVVGTGWKGQAKQLLSMPIMVT